jgi:hypothetical protein
MGRNRCCCLMAIALLTSCQSRPPAEDRSYKLPTATEVFHLRSECARLGEKIMEENLIGGALSQPQESHYDPKTNRCYVQLTVMSAKPGDYTTDLYDGQTREMLAFASVEHGEKVGVVFVPQNTFDKPGRKLMGTTNTDAGFTEAREFINKAMEDNRRQ